MLGRLQPYQSKKSSGCSCDAAQVYRDSCEENRIMDHRYFIGVVNDLALSSLEPIVRAVRRDH